MIDVFTEEIEVQIKRGISNLYWYKEDLKKAWLRSGVELNVCDRLFNLKNDRGEKLSKRELMDSLYSELRNFEYNKRLEISRNFVRLLVEHSNFVPLSDGHRIDIAETCALKLKQIIEEQRKQTEYNQHIKRRVQEVKKLDYDSELSKIREQFLDAEKLTSQKRGYELEKIFTQLMRISGIPVEDSFKIIGEQIDGAIKYDGNYYLIELKWTTNPSAHQEVSSLYVKVEGKMGARGLFISMNGYSKEIVESLPKGKEIKVLFFDGTHIANVIFGNYTFQELMEHAISQASLKSNIYCSHDLKK
ncbi:MAG: restriction endonuclease [Candidatus Azobacteroides sp.]|nr:restriction endonuclease [Candidatus Azobacteroides sp.]